MEEASADCIHCSQGVYASTHTIIPPSVFPRAGYVEHAAEMKKAVQIPVIAVGRINDVEIAESVLQSKKADRSYNPSGSVPVLFQLSQKTL